jgi:hypothetical protein
MRALRECDRMVRSGAVLAGHVRSSTTQSAQSAHQSAILAIPESATQDSHFGQFSTLRRRELLLVFKLKGTVRMEYKLVS